MAATIKIQIETTGGVDAVKKDIQELGQAAKESGGGFSAMQEIATGALRAIGEGVVGLAVKGFGMLSDAISDGIADARQNAQIQAQTAAVIKSTGEAAGVSAQHVMDYASSLSDAAGKSLFGDDQIQQSTNLLLTFTEIKGATLDAATAISVDMAQALGGEPKDAAIQLGKALNDPIKGITALTRVGVTFSDEQRAQIQAMQEAGDTAGAQAVILAELNKEFGGSAEAAAAATGGWSEFNGRLGEAKEALGAALLPLLNQFAGVLNDTVLPLVESAAAAFGAWLADPATQAGIQMFSDGIGVVVGVISDLVSVLVEAGPFSSEFGETIGGIATQLGLPVEAANLLEQAIFALQGAIQAALPLFTGELPASLLTTGETFTQLQATIGTVMAGIQAVVGAVLPVIAAFWQAHGAEIMAFVQEAWARIQTIIQTALQLIAAIVGPALQAIASFISAHGAEIQALLTNTWNAIKAVVDAALTLIQGVLKAALQVIQGDWSGAWNTIQQMSARIVQDIITVIQSGIGNIVTLFGGLAAQVIDTLAALPGQAATIGGNIISGIISGVEGAAGSLYNTLRNIADSALQAAKDAIGVGSPSRDFANEVGIPIVQGIVAGIRQTSGQLLSTLAGVAGQAVTHTSTLVAGMADILANSGLGGDGEQIGADILAGIAEGIKDNLRSVVSVVNSAANTVKDAFQGALGIHSPSAIFADEVGAPIMQGLIEGVQGMIPGLTDMLNTVAASILSHVKKVTEKVVDEANKIQDELLKQAEGIADKLSGVMADALMGTASLDRAKAKAIGALKDISAAQQEEVQKQLAAAAQTAGGFGDPKQAAAFFKQRSDQIFELAKLRDQIEKTTDEAAKARLIEQYNLIGKAQQAELQAFDVKGGSTTLQAITAQLQKILGDRNLPGVLEDQSGVLGQLFAALPQLVAMTTTPGPSAASSVSSSSFTYAPTISTTGHVSAPMDLALATSLAGV